MPRSLRVQVQSLSVLPILGLAAVSISVSMVLTHQQVDAEASRNLGEVAHLLATTTRDRSEALAAQTQLLADLPTLRSAMLTHDNATISDRAGFFVKRNPKNALLVTDTDG